MKPMYCSLLIMIFFMLHQSSLKMKTCRVQFNWVVPDCRSATVFFCYTLFLFPDADTVSSNHLQASFGLCISLHIHCWGLLQTADMPLSVGGWNRTWLSSFAAKQMRIFFIRVSDVQLWSKMKITLRSWHVVMRQKAPIKHLPNDALWWWMEEILHVFVTFKKPHSSDKYFVST